MTFDAALNAYTSALQTRIHEMFDRQFQNLAKPTISAEKGRKYVKIWENDKWVAGRRRIHSFIRVEDGAILKAATWKAPFIAKGGPNCAETVRGSIYTPDHGMSSVSEYGVKYIR